MIARADGHVRLGFDSEDSLRKPADGVVKMKTAEQKKKKTREGWVVIRRRGTSWNEMCVYVYE